MDLLRGNIKTLYFKYLSAAFGSALISSIYGIVDMAMVGQYFTAAVIGSVILAALAWVGLILFERPLLMFFGTDETLLALAQQYMIPIKVVFSIMESSSFRQKLMQTASRM